MMISSRYCVFQELYKGPCKIFQLEKLLYLMFLTLKRCVSNSKKESVKLKQNNTTDFVSRYR